MDGIPEKCPTCRTEIPEGAVRCPGCGRVFGEDNRCPHCHAIAAVRAAHDGFVCLACGKPRDRLPQTTVHGEPDARMSLAPLAPVSTPRTGALGTLGTVSALAGLFASGAALALLGTSGIGLLIAVAVAVAGVGGGAALITAGRARSRGATAAQNRALEQRILALAAKRNGNLTASDVATAFRISVAAADGALTRMSDGDKITAEVDEVVGALHFVFHDLVPAVPKTRVEIGSEGEGESASASATESESESKKRALERE
jgi:hypothetical protein